MSATNVNRIAKWLIRVGKERVLLWSINVKIKQEDPFTSMLYKGFQAGGLGEDYASYKLADVKIRARRAKKHIFDYLLDLKNSGRLSHFLKNDLKLGPNSISAVAEIINLETKYNLRIYPQNVNIDLLYDDLAKMKGIGDHLRHYIIYDLIRLFGFEAPKTLGPSKRVLKAITVFNL